MAVVINGTTGISGVDGSAGTPALQGTDTNTGIFYGVDTVSIATNGATALTADSSSNIAIANNLSVTGTTTQTGQLLTSAGTAGAPAIARSGDADNGIFFPATNTMAISTAGTEDMRFTPEGNVTMNSATFSPTTPSTAGNLAMTGTLAMGSSFKRNRIINGNMYIAQRATSATVTAGTGVPTASTGYPCVDRWFVYSTGANVTAAQVAGTGSNRSVLRITGAASVTAVGVGQRIEQLNSIDMAGQTATLSVELANSVLTTVTWTASYANTADTFGTIGTPTKTQIATGTFTVNSTLTRYTTNISIPAAATTGIEILFTVGAQTSGTWDVDNVQLEVGSVATPYERQIYTDQLLQCQRYYQIGGLGIGSTFPTTAGNIGNPITLTTTTFGPANVVFNPVMRAAPTVRTADSSGTIGNARNYSAATNIAITTDVRALAIASIGVTGQTAGNIVCFQYDASAEL